MDGHSKTVGSISFSIVMGSWPGNAQSGRQRRTISRPIKCVGLLLHATNRRWLGSSAPFYIALLSPPAAAMVFHSYHPQSTVDGQQPGPPILTQMKLTRSSRVIWREKTHGNQLEPLPQEKEDEDDGRHGGLPT